MSLLYRILYAAHASGTHHKLALRAVALLDGPNAEGWRRLLLAQAKPLLEGSKAPDVAFKDFQNHVLHPASAGGAEWGGAPKLAQQWADRARVSLAARRWSEAAYALGVASHYYTDPWMPFHTGSSEEENVVHRAVEWSVSRSFETLWSLVEPRLPSLAKGVSAPAGPDFAASMTRAAATASAARYRDLVTHYDFEIGVDDPEAGLDEEAQDFVSELLGKAALGLARLLERVTADAGVAPPSVDLALPTVIAGLGMPVAFVTKKLADAADRAEVCAIYDELAATGRVVKALPTELRVVRQAKRAAQDAARAAAAPELIARETESLAARAGVSAVAKPKPGEVLERGAPVAKAPSIGAKTAARLAELGVGTVGDLLDADPAELAAKLDDRRIDARAVTAWRDQAALLARVPKLKPAYAVLLVASGYRDVLALAGELPERLRARLAQTAAKAEVKKLLRRVEEPDLAAAARIVETARAALAA